MSKIKNYMEYIADHEENVLLENSNSTKKEIERKFLVKNNDWKSHVVGSNEIYQLYLSTDPAVRVRMRNCEATLTIKSSVKGSIRNEFEYVIPYEDAVEMFKIFGDNVITKIRHVVCDYKTDHTWEIDEFRGYNSGLVIAEIELSSEDEEINMNHSWLGDEVTHDNKYYNAYLFNNPYTKWK